MVGKTLKIQCDKIQNEFTFTENETVLILSKSILRDLSSSNEEITIQVEINNRMILFENEPLYMMHEYIEHWINKLRFQSYTITIKKAA